MEERRVAEKLFVLVMSNIKKIYEEECNMAIDVFLEEDFTIGELQRMLSYLLDKVDENHYKNLILQIEKQIGNLTVK